MLGYRHPIVIGNCDLFLIQQGDIACDQLLVARELAGPPCMTTVRGPPGRTTTLRGYEYMALVEQKTPSNLKLVSVRDISGGWHRLVRRTGALVLFGCGFGETIFPTEASANYLCNF